MNKNTQIVVIGGSTGGASFAAQAKRTDEYAHIILIEKTAYVSTAYCGLAYGLGSKVADTSTLVPVQPETLAQRFEVDVRTQQQVLSIDRVAQQVKILDHKNGHHYWQAYDKLLLSPGASTAVPNISGNNLPGVFSLRTVSDLKDIIAWMDAHQPQRAVVVGGGFIGLEIVENLAERHIQATIVEAGWQLMPKIDPEMARIIEKHCAYQGVHQLLGCTITKIEPTATTQLKLHLDNGEQLTTDMVMLVTGTRIESQLAKEAGLTLSESTGAIVVDNTMATSDPLIYAIGDAVEIPCLVTQLPIVVQLAAPLSQQVRVAVSHMLNKTTPYYYRGALGTFVCKIFDLTIAATGPAEKTLKKYNIAYQKVILPTTNHVFFYPEVEQIHLKILFDSTSGRLLGAQAVGGEGTEKRIDVLAVAITAGMTIYDLEFLELSYAPPYSAPRDPVNLVGSTAVGLIRGDVRGIYADEIPSEAVLVDIRSPDEHLLASIPNAINIPAYELRQRLDEIPRGHPVVVFCQIGSQSNSAQRMLTQKGFNCFNLLGGYAVWRLFNSEVTATDYQLAQMLSTNATKPSLPEPANEIDVRGLTCPGPILSVRQRLDKLAPGSQATILVDDPGFMNDFQTWCYQYNHQIIQVTQNDNFYAISCLKATQTSGVARLANQRVA
jgi:NADPH-dependent 2,4-dienoyl-CoA reductase/sulfur reductase-like enzyme/TusA-related sulfurtransferase/rhodanese-related sulfurtransferase